MVGVIQGLWGSRVWGLEIWVSDWGTASDDEKFIAPGSAPFVSAKNPRKKGTVEE